MGLEKGGLNVLCKLQLEGNEKLIDQKSKMLLIAPIPTDSILMTQVDILVSKNQVLKI